RRVEHARVEVGADRLPAGFDEDAQPAERAAAHVERAPTLAGPEPREERPAGGLPHLRLHAQPLALRLLAREEVLAHPSGSTRCARHSGVASAPSSAQTSKMRAMRPSSTSKNDAAQKTWSPAATRTRLVTWSPSPTMRSARSESQPG